MDGRESRRLPSMLICALACAAALWAEEATFEGKAAQAWMTALQSEDALVRLNALKALRALQVKSESAAAAVAGRLQDPRSGIRSEAASLLGAMGAATVPFVPKLVEALRDESPDVRKESAAALGAIAHSTPAALQALLRASQDREPGVRMAAGSALLRLGASDEILKVVLANALKDPLPGVRRWAIGCVGTLGARGAWAIPMILPYVAEAEVGDDEIAVEAGRARRKAIRALGSIAPLAQAIGPLVGCMRSPDARTRARAAEALAGYGPEVLPALLEQLRDPFHAADAAVLALIALGEKAVPAIPDVARLLRYPNPEMRERAASALLRLGEPGRWALVEAQGDADPAVQQIARRALETLGRRGPFACRTIDRQQLLAGGGGNADTERAVAEALGWLARHVSDDGAWDPVEFQAKREACRCEGRGYGEYRVGVNGLCILAFLGAGHRPTGEVAGETSEFGAILRSALDGLLREQRPDGFIGNAQVAKQMYNHAIATQALAEAYGMTGEARYREPAQRAVAFLSAAKNPRRGWRYSPGSGENDTSVTTWCVRALKTAELVGLDVEPAMFADALAFIEEVTERHYGKCGYQRVEDAGVKVVVQGKNDDYTNHETLTAMGMTTRLLASGRIDDSMLKLGARVLVQDLPTWDVVKKTNDCTYWHEGTFALYLHDGPAAPHGGKYWKPWNRTVRTVLLANQRKEGCERGSWPVDDRWGFEGGRVAIAALNALTLETYYRYPYLMRGERGSGAASGPAATAAGDEDE